MNKKKPSLKPTGRNGDYLTYEVDMPSSISNTMEAQSEIFTHYDKSSSLYQQLVNASSTVVTETIETKSGKTYNFLKWGDDNEMPYRIQELMGSCMVTARCQLFNIEVCYGQGLQFFDRGTDSRASGKDIRDFCLHNAIHRQFWQQATDMKYLYLSATVVTLCRDRSRVVAMRQLDMTNCRFAWRGNVKGYPDTLLVADWRNLQNSTIVDYPLLDEVDPLGDLLVRLGKAPSPETGETKVLDNENLHFAIVSRVPTLGSGLYPIPYYLSIIIDSWYDVCRLIGRAKKFMIANTAAPRLQVEIHKNYWNNVCNEEGITDPQERKKRIRKEREDINAFCTKPENAGKAWITSYDTVIDGREVRMVRVYTLGADGKKQGGEWSEDMAEAANSLCFALGVHPNMVGATPGKSQMNNSGSDKRELFNLKQAIEKAWHDVMEVPYHVMLHYNKWDEKYDIKVPMIEMTTLDKNKEMEITTGEDNGNNNQ